MAAEKSRDRRPAWLPLAAAAVVVPTVLAGLTLAWPRPQVEGELTRTAAEALAAAGFPGARAAVEGRDVTISGVTGADGPRAVEAVQAVAGVRVARVPAAAGEDGAGPRADGAAGEQGGTTGGDRGDAAAPGDAAGAGNGTSTSELDAVARQRLQAGVDQLVAAAPITFGPDSAELTATGRATVEQVLALVSPVTGARLQVDGFVAAGPGNGRLSAQELSVRRAAAVRDALVAGGVPADRIITRGLGEVTTPTDPAADRRVEITVV